MSQAAAPKRKARKRASIDASRPSRDSPSLTSIGFLLHLALRKIGDGIVEALDGSGLHPGHLGLLGALTDRGPMSQRRLGDITRIEKSSVVLFVDALEAGGWVRRVRDPNDRRAHLVELTSEGAARFATLGARMLSVQEAFLAPLSAEERDRLVELLVRVTRDDAAGAGRPA
jgi:DNA-binding MarR family transcriptional regulator